MKNTKSLQTAATALGLVLVAAAGPAVAQVDTAAAATEIGNAVTAISTIGGLLIGAAAVVMSFNWVKAQFF